MQPPVASPIDTLSIVHGLLGLFRGERYKKLLDDDLKGWFGVRNVWKVSSGKAALVLILRALSRLAPERSEVIIPAYTCFSVPSAVVKAGLKVVPCDVHHSTFDYDFAMLHELVGKKTLCVVSCHLFGIASDINSVRAICREQDAFVVEDAAQAMGIEVDGTKLGTQGDVGFFSLGRGKNITCGSGGIILTMSDRIAEQLADEYRSLSIPGIFESTRSYIQLLLQSIFTHPLLFWFPAGIPQLRIGETLFMDDFPIKKLSGMAAGLLWKWIERLDKANRGRQETGQFFAEQLHAQTNANPSVPYLRLPFLAATREQKEALMSLPEAHALGLSQMYPAGVDAIRQLDSVIRGRTFPMANEIAGRLVTIPTHYLLTNEDKVRICRLIRPFMSDSKPFTHA